MKSEDRYCADIDMVTIDRPIDLTCRWATKFCRLHCFNVKLHRLYPAMEGKDVRNEAWWQQLTGAELKRVLDRKKRNTSRVRLMSRGEAFSTLADIDRVLDFARTMPDRIFWIPTRAWRNPIMRAAIEGQIMPLSNVALNASLDPTHTQDEYRDLVSAGWSTMYFGDGSGWEGPAETSRFDCPKTTHTEKHPKGIKGFCSRCRGGCFSQVERNKRTDVYLTKH
jgi:hypothetical protein